MIAMVALVLTALAVPCAAAEPNPAEVLQQARDAMDAQRYDDALESYRAVEPLLPDRPELTYNQGLVWYRKGDYAKAAGYFGKVLGIAGRELDAKAQFNLGNCAYAAALKLQEKEPDTAVEQLRQAMLHYRDALQNDPKDTDARANIELASALIKQLQKKEEQQQEQKQQQQSQPSSQPESQPESQSAQSQPSSQPQSSEGQQQKGEQGQQQQGEQQEGQKSEEQKAQEQDAKEQKGKLESQSEDKSATSQPEQQPMAVPATQRAMTPEELERLLQLIRDKERQRALEQQRRDRGPSVPVEKDW